MVSIKHNLSVDRKTWAALVDRKERLNSLRAGAGVPPFSLHQVVELLAKHATFPSPETVTSFVPTTRRPGRPRKDSYS